ncbi:putative quinol monooxygenase [Thalassomonas actiniarum]|uniref:Antibiotic biosynthesis monooxygenase n=1 Tax=Thalassomonas actiniarum TaxID=485447 RepID=A0AAE9YXQ8_9GAMM|nr:antibiotic biosynthesis monooxygenase family protein [Thalassomonas actiniarum]WDE02497.1 antibiotic biosynthesis monooxygenase [Thalassomonas actiniarum]
MSITRINEFLAAEGKAEELFTFLKSLMSYISSSDGCQSCEVLQNKDNENIFVVIEKWDSENSHKQSIENYPKEKMAAAMSIIGAPPKGSFYRS